LICPTRPKRPRAPPPAEPVRRQHATGHTIRIACRADRVNGPAGLLDNDPHGSNVPVLNADLDSNVHCTLRQEHVLPEIAEASRDPTPPSQPQEVLIQAVALEAREEVGVGQHRLVQSR
jgi:hypothetical protein